MHKKKLLLLSALAFACACAPANPSQQAAAPKPLFFDLPKFFAEEAARLGSRSVRKESRAYTNKTAAIADTTSVQIENSAQWEREFALFSRTQLNKSSFRDQYDIDSLRNDSAGTLLLRYRARKAHLYTQSVEIRLQNEQVQHISIQTRQHSLLTESSQQLQYTPDKSYSLQQSQSLPFAQPHTVELHAVLQ
jgi:hypothetical protein